MVSLATVRFPARAATEGEVLAGDGPGGAPLQPHAHELGRGGARRAMVDAPLLMAVRAYEVRDPQRVRSPPTTTRNPAVDQRNRLLTVRAAGSRPARPTQRNATVSVSFLLQTSVELAISQPDGYNTKNIVVKYLLS